VAALSAKQQCFVDEYLVDLNATQAAIRAGYSERSAAVTSSRLLANAKIQAAIQERQSKRAKRLDISVDRIEQELARIAFFDVGKAVKWGPHGVTLVDSEELTDDDRAAIAEVSETTTEHGGSQKIKFHSKIDALELLGKRHGMFVEKHEHKHALTTADLVMAASVGTNETDDG
jgi:phage terminase small subunit